MFRMTVYNVVYMYYPIRVCSTRTADRLVFVLGLSPPKTCTFAKLMVLSTKPHYVTVCNYTIVLYRPIYT